MLLRPNKPTRREVLEENQRIAEAAKKTALLCCAAIAKLGGSIRFNAADFAAAGDMQLEGVVDGEEMVFSVKTKTGIVLPDGSDARPVSDAAAIVTEAAPK